MSVELGAVRQVWFAKLTAPTARFPFLIRDDARSKSGAVFGRTIRLGDPVSLGPNSSWRQTSWVGGIGQETWKDEEMVKDATCDLYTKPGKVRMSRAFTDLISATDRGYVERLALGQNSDTAEHWYAAGDHLLAGEDTQFFFGQTPTDDYKLWAFTPPSSGGAIQSFEAGIKAVSTGDEGDAGQHAFVGLANGQIFRGTWNGTTYTDWTLEHTVTNGLEIGENSFCQYSGALYCLAGPLLVKRVNGVSTTPTYSELVPSWLGRSMGLTVWNNRLWFTYTTFGRKSSLYVSDGITVTKAFDFPEAFEPQGVIAYAGSLYIYGGKYVADRFTSVGQIWRYTGSSLSLLWEPREDEYDIGSHEHHTINQAIVYQNKLWWTRNGYPGNDNLHGMMVYDSEVDAIYRGPMQGNSIAQADSGPTLVSGAFVFDNRPIMARAANNSAPAETNYWVVDALSRTQIKRTTATKEEYVLSSIYDGETPGEQKVWLTAKIRAKIPSDCEVDLALILDEGSEQTVGTLTSNGDVWGQFSIPLKVDGDYLRSTTIQYKLVLRNEEASATSTKTPEVDDIVIDFLPSPAKRRQWAVRIVGTDAQQLLGGSASEFTTSAAIEEKVEELWGEQRPLLFWDASTSGTEPTGTTGAVEVMPLTFSGNSARVASDEDEMYSETAFSFFEVV